MNETRSFGGAFPLGYRPAGPTDSRYDTPYLARRADFQIGNAEVRPSVRTVDGPLGAVQAEPRVMQVLVALVDAGGAVLTREDLIRSCWKGQIVGDDAINRAIGELRRVARKTGAGFEVQTIPRIGYRLIEGIDGLAGGAQDDLREPAPALSRRRAIGGGLALAAGGAGLWSLAFRAPDPAEKLIAESRAIALAGTADAEAAAIALLEKATAMSPDNADAWGRLALQRARADEHGSLNPSRPLSAIAEPARRALSLDSTNADAKSALALAIPYYGDWFEAERRFDAILAEHPRHVETRDSLSFFMGAVGRMRDSAVERQSFAHRAPLDANLQFRQIYALWFLDRIPEADRIAMRGLEMWPRHAGLWFGRLWMLSGTGRIDRALAQVSDEAGRPPLPPPMIATLRMALSATQSRDPAAVDTATKMIMGGVSKSVTAVVNAMMLLNLMGATDAAFALADAYYLERGPVLAAMSWRPGQPVVPDQRRRKTNMMFTPVAAAMQTDPRFMPLMEQIGMTAYWKRAGVVPDFLKRRPA